MADIPGWAQDAPQTQSNVPAWAQGSAVAPPVHPRAAGATGLDMIGQTFSDIMQGGAPANHDPNAIEQGIMDVAQHPLVRSAVGDYQQAALNGLFAQPTRFAMEHLGVGRQPGESDASLHQRYSAALLAARQQAQQTSADAEIKGDQNIESLITGQRAPMTFAQHAERTLQQGIGLGAGIAANPQYFLIPGGPAGGAGGGLAGAATRIGAVGGYNAIIGGASDTAAQLMDMAEGDQKSFDVDRSLKSAAISGLFGVAVHGAVEATPFVKSLFTNRGVDTTPAPNPTGSPITPMTQDHIPLNQADAVQYRQLLQHGSVDDIKGFFQGRNGPQPSWTEVNDWVEHRDNGPSVNGRPAAEDTSRQPEFNYEQQYNDHAQQQWAEQNHQAVEEHVNNQMASWKNAPQVEVVHDPSQIEDPQIRAQVTAEDPDGDALGVRGADGKVRLFSGRITDPDTASAVLFHEGLGHHGLSAKFGDKLDSTLTSMLDRNVNGLSRDTDAWISRNPGAYGGDRIRAAEEVLAEASEKGQTPRSWQDAMSSTVRQFGRKMGLKLAYSDGEVRNVLAMAHDAVINGKPDAAANGFRGATQDPNKFMFIGKKAHEFDPTDNQTTYTGQDGNVRNEISDHESKLMDVMKTDPNDKYAKFDYKLSDVLHHPELYERYPQLRDLPVRYSALLRREGLGGYYNIDNPHIGLDNSGSDIAGSSPHRILLHEVQHAIQHIEGQIHNDGAMIKDENGNWIDNPNYPEHNPEPEAEATEYRQHMTPEERSQYTPRFMRSRDPLNRETANPDKLDDVDRLKADPRFWSDPEFRKNVIELARTRGPIDRGAPDNSFTPKWSSEAEARASADNKFVTQAQLDRARIARKDYNPDDIEGIAQHLSDNYVPNRVSAEETRTAALKSGIKPSDIRRLAQSNPGELAARVARVGAAADYAAAKVGHILERLDTPEWKPEDQVALAHAIAERNYLVQRFKGEANEAGRALATVKTFKQYSNGNLADIMEQLRDQDSGLAALADPTNPNGIRFARQLKAMLTPGIGHNGGPGSVPSNPQGAQTMMAGVNKPYWEQYLTTFHMNMMLSALSTHVKAPIDMGTGIARNVIEKVVAMPIGQARQLFERMTGRTVKPGVEVAELANHIIGITRAVTDAEVYRAMWHAAKTGEGSYVDVGGNRVPSNFQNQFGTLSNPRIPGISKPTDLISAQDTFFRSTEMNAQLLTVGTREARVQLGPKATTFDVMTLGHHLAANPTPSMIKEAWGETNRTLLLNDNPLNSLINRARVYRPGMTPWQRFGAFVTSNLAPFIRVESNNLLNRVIQRSPAAFLDPHTIGELKAGGARADIAMAKIVYGTTLLGMYWVAADQGKKLLTGAGATSVDKYKEDIAAGRVPEAVHENGGYNTGGQLGMSVNPFDLHNKTAQIVASAHQAWDEGMNQHETGTAVKLALSSIMHDIGGMSWVSDLAPLVDAIRAHGTQGESVVSGFAANEAKSWLPSAMNQAARISDPNMRDTTSPHSIGGHVLNELQSEVPGLREQLPIKYSVYGTPLQNGASLTGVHTIIPGLSGNGTTETHDPAERELDRLNQTDPKHTLVTPTTKSIAVHNEDGSTQMDETGHTVTRMLSPIEAEHYQQVAGRYIVESVREEMNSPDWRTMSDQDKIDTVRDIEKDMKAAAREDLFYHETSDH